MLRQLNDMMIRTKIALAFGGMLGLSLMLGVFAMDRLGAVDAGVRADVPNPVVALAKLGISVERMRAAQNNILAAPAGSDTSAADAAVTTAFEMRAKAWQDYNRHVLSADEQPLADAISKQWDGYVAVAARVQDMLKKGDGKAAIALNNGDSLTAVGHLRRAIQADVDFNLRTADAEAPRGNDGYAPTRGWILSLMALIAAFGVAAGWLLIVGVSRPVAAMADAVKKFAEGDMDATISAAGRKDEVGAMAAAVQVIKDGMILSMQRHAEQAAEHVEHEKRQAAVDSFVRDFETTVGGVLEMVASASNQLESTAQSMSSTADVAQRQSTAVAAASE